MGVNWHISFPTAAH